MRATQQRIAVCGAAVCDRATYERARRVGCLLAEAGAVLLCGGRGGVMEGACRGAREGGGLTVGLLPGARPDEANPYVDLPIVTNLGQARNAVLVLSAQAVIAISGGAGTLSEIAFALKLGRPVVGLGTWRMVRGDGQTEDGILYADSPEQAVEWALEGLNSFLPRER
ncbi:MAG: TIGR00725 family protein [Chloroflexia bacterium]|nr:TIGR00725 family protein [Chloroflexia bacterium]